MNKKRETLNLGKFLTLTTLISHKKGLLRLCCFFLQTNLRNTSHRFVVHQTGLPMPALPLGKQVLEQETFEMASALVGFLLHAFIVCIYAYVGVWVCVWVPA